MSFAQLPVYGDNAAVVAARAALVIDWLDDMNWHDEAKALKDRIRTSAPVSAALSELAEHLARAAEIDSVASFLNSMYDWRVQGNEWQATKGDTLVEELWSMIRMKSDKPECAYDPDHTDSKGAKLTISRRRDRHRLDIGPVFVVTSFSDKIPAQRSCRESMLR